jgi:hypothetical protein
MNVFL